MILRSRRNSPVFGDVDSRFPVNTGEMAVFLRAGAPRFAYAR
ncbi:hypothetical protein SVIOM342S_01286 [Streptomyces violaceorubidus]